MLPSDFAKHCPVHKSSGSETVVVEDSTHDFASGVQATDGQVAAVHHTGVGVYLESAVSISDAARHGKRRKGGLVYSDGPVRFGRLLVVRASAIQLAGVVLAFVGLFVVSIHRSRQSRSVDADLFGELRNRVSFEFPRPTVPAFKMRASL